MGLVASGRLEDSKRGALLASEGVQFAHALRVEHGDPAYEFVVLGPEVAHPGAALNNDIVVSIQRCVGRV
jgi:hypothetical protein